jgi:RHS repeat-associated protein
MPFPRRLPRRTAILYPMKLRSILLVLASWSLLAASLHAVTFTCSPPLLFLYPGETKHIRVSVDEAGKISATVNSGSPGPFTLPFGAVVGTNFVEIECQAADSVSSPASGSRSISCTFTPASGSPQNGMVSVNIFVLPNPSTQAANTDNAEAGDPVNTRSGEYYAVEGVDMDLGGPMPLFFARYNGSRLAADGRTASSFGANRLHQFESRLVYPGARHVDIITNRGRVVSFVKSGKTWALTRSLDVPYRLVESGTTFILGDPQTQQMWTYDAATGRLLKIEDGRGNVHTLTWGTVAPIRLESVSDGLGRSLNFTYNGTGKLITVTDHTGRHVDFVHTGAVLTSSTTALGFTTTYAHASNLLTSFTRPEGNTPFTQVHTSNRVTSQTERGTDTSTLSYLGLTTTFTDPTAATIVDAYSNQGELVTHTDQAGRSMTMTYDATGRRTSVTDRLGDTTTISYHAGSGLPELITSADGRTSKRTYKSRTVKGLVFHDLASITHPDGSSRAFTYDASGNLTALTDEAGKKWKFTHNSRGQVLTVSNPNGGVFTFAYDAAGNLTSSKDPDTEATTYAYDALHRLTTITRPGGATVAIAYDADDRMTSITDERGKTHAFTYDNNGRLTVITDPDTKTTAFAYDALDRVNQVTDRLGKISSVTHDSRRLLATFTDRNGNTTTWQHDSRQRPSTMIDAGSQVWVQGYDDEGLQTSVATPIDPPTLIKRNRLGRVVEIADPLGNTTRFVRDARQRVVQRFDGLGRLTTFAYDKRGLITSAGEQGTALAKFDRDGLGKVTKMTDPNGGTWAFTYTKAGRLSSMTDPLGRKTSHTYDNRGRRATTTFADATTETLAYDSAGNLTRRLFTDGTDLNFTYDNLNRLTATNGLELSYDFEGRITNCRQHGADFSATYDFGGRLTTVGYLDNAVIVTYQYDTRNRLVKVSDSVSGAEIDFAYDNAGRLLTTTRSNGVNGTRTYDDAGRLKSISEGAFLVLDYRLNAAGEVTEVDFSAPTTPQVAAAPADVLKFNKGSQIATAGYVYDLRGRLTASPGKTFNWDGASRMTGTAAVPLGYNGLGDVISSATTNFAHHYAIALAPIVTEVPVSANARCYVWTPDGRLLYSIDLGSSQPTFYHFDRIGSTLALTDAAGAVTDSYAYGPYGEALGHAGNSSQPFTYVGEWGVRKEGDLYHMRARYYDPATARFLSRDPAPIGVDQPKRLNVYEYAAQNPLMYIDPEGAKERQPHPDAERLQKQDASLPRYYTPEQEARMKGEGGAMGLALISGFLWDIHMEDYRKAEQERLDYERMVNQAIYGPIPTLPPPAPPASEKAEQPPPVAADTVKPAGPGTTGSEMLQLSPPPGASPPVPKPIRGPGMDLLRPFRKQLRELLEDLQPDSILDQITEVIVIC